MGVARRGLSVSSLLHSSFNLFLVSKFFLFCFSCGSPFSLFSAHVVEHCSCVSSLSPCFSLCRGCAVPDGRGPQTDPSAARGDGLYSELKRFLTVQLNTTWIQFRSFNGRSVLVWWCGSAPKTICPVMTQILPGAIDSMG